MANNVIAAPICATKGHVFCKSDELIKAAGYRVFEPEVRQALRDLMAGRANPLIDELLAGPEEMEWRE